MPLFRITASIPLPGLKGSGSSHTEDGADGVILRRADTLLQIISQVIATHEKAHNLHLY